MARISEQFAKSSNLSYSADLTLIPEYELTYNGTKTNPQFPNAHFQVGGLDFVTIVSSGTGGCAYSINIQLTESSIATLADGWSIRVVYRVGFRNEETTPRAHGPGLIKTALKTKTFSSTDSKIHIFCFDTRLVMCNVELKLMFCNVYPYQHYFLDQAAAAKRHADCRIIVKGQEDDPIYAHKSLLAMDSEYFHSLFFGNFQESQTDTVELQETTVLEVLEYLYCIYPPNRPFRPDQIETVLKLADRFLNESLSNSVIGFLITILHDEDTPTATKVLINRVAAQYRCPELFCSALEARNADPCLVKSLRKRQRMANGNVQAFMEDYADLLLENQNGDDDDGTCMKIKNNSKPFAIV